MKPISFETLNRICLLCDQVLVLGKIDCKICPVKKLKVLQQDMEKIIKDFKQGGEKDGKIFDKRSN